MNLAIDHGNTRIKVGVFEGNTLHSHLIFDKGEAFNKWTSQNSFDNLIISSVLQSSVSLIKPILVKGKKIKLSQSLSVPIEINYATRETLGVDRIAAACGAIELKPGHDCLVIDMGTCINYEFVNSKATYFGGAISPGIKMRFQAMHTFTAKLPLVNAKENVELTGRSTEESMQSGVMNGILGEVDGVISMYKAKYPNLAVILCGGDATLFENKLKQPIFVAPNLVLTGLNRILLHNVNF